MGRFGFDRARVGLLGCVVVVAGLACAAAAVASGPAVSRVPVLLAMPARPGFSMSPQELGASALRTGGAHRSVLPSRVGSLLPWLSRADSNTYMGPGGRLVTEIFEAPVNYLSSSGSYVPIDAALRMGTAGFVQRANDLGMVLPRSAAGFIRVASRRGSLRFGLLGASGSGSVAGSVERFSGGEPGRVSRGLRKEDDPSSGEENLLRCHVRGSIHRS